MRITLWTPSSRILPCVFPWFCQTGDRVLVNAQLADLAGAVKADEGAGLLSLSDNLVRHYFRLQDAERTFPRAAREMRPGAGRRAIVQMERERAAAGQRPAYRSGSDAGGHPDSIGDHCFAASRRRRIRCSRRWTGFGRCSAEALAQVRAISRKLHPPEWHAPDSGRRASPVVGTQRHSPALEASLSSRSCCRTSLNRKSRS